MANLIYNLNCVPRTLVTACAMNEVEYFHCDSSLGFVQVKV